MTDKLTWLTFAHKGETMPRTFRHRANIVFKEIGQRTWESTHPLSGKARPTRRVTRFRVEKLVPGYETLALGDIVEVLDVVPDDEAGRLREAIKEHARSIQLAGQIRVFDAKSAERASMKQAADEKLWEAIS